MRKFTLVMFAVIIAAIPSMASAQTVGGRGEPDGLGLGDYSKEVLEEYYQCMERYDLFGIREILRQHKEVAKIDGRIYGLPEHDFDDSSLLTIEERLRYRKQRKEVLAKRPDQTPQATSGPLQYPHHLRHSLDHYYEVSGERPDCSDILDKGGVPGPQKGLGSGWASDLDLTAFDSRDRGEVDIVIDYANPNRIMASSVSSGGGPEGTSDLILYTADWGQTWNATGVGNNSGTTWECDPVSYYQRSTGNVYHSKIGCSNNFCSQTYTMMRVSADNGASWSDCARPDSNTGEDRQWHVVDNTTTSGCYGNIYITWHDSNVEKVVRSTDNCASWGTVTDLATSSITPDINVAADGHVYVVWQRHGDATFKIAGSDDCGATWTSPATKTVKNRWGDWKNNIPAQCQRGISTMPNVDVDRCPWSQFYGRVYMTMFDFDQTGCGSGPGCTDWSNACDYDIYFTYSDDQGATFAAPVNITRDILGHGDMVDSFMGYMRVDESDGSIYIGYHRTRLNPTSLADREKTHYFMTRSIDGGASWAEMQVSTLEGDEKVSGASTFERGDYNHIDVFEGVAYPVFIDRRGGTTVEENVITRKICTEPSHRSERAPTYSAPILTLTTPGAGTVDIAWTAPDAHWGDGGEDVASRKYQLWVDGALAQDNILWTATSVTGYDPGDCSNHDYFIRVINQCGISKDYATTTFAATGCCPGNPSVVDVQPDGPLTFCTGTGQTLSLTLTGGTSPFSYQWTRDGADISGATASTYTANDTGTHTYNCLVTGQGCTGGTMDLSSTQITWKDTPDFGGLETVTTPNNTTCTLDLAWTAATSICGGAITYNIYRSTSSGFTPSGASLITSGVTGTSYSDSDGLVSGDTYYYIVRAVDSSTLGEEANMVEQSGVPLGPIGVGTKTYTFESGDEGWTLTGFGRDSSTAHGGSWSMHSSSGADNACDSAISPAFEATATSGMTLWIYYDIEAQSTGKWWDRANIHVIEVVGGAHTLISPTSGAVYNASAGSAGTLCHIDLEAGWGDNNGPVWESATFDLSAWNGLDIQIEVNYNTDAATALTGFWFDDVALSDIITETTCTTGSGCSDPGAPVITLITDNDVCAQDGVTINFTGGSGAASHDLWVDGSEAVVGFTTGSTYNPGDSVSHSYVVRAIDSTCFTDSSASSFTDATGPGAPSITSITDDDACAQTGIRVNYDAGLGATSHSLWRDGAEVVANYTSGTLYNPGDTASHSYVVRAINGSCTADSTGSAFSDAAGIPTPAAPAVSDVSACALSGVQISWGAVAGATAYDLLVDGTTTVSGVTSPHTYSPGDNASHTYQIRGRSASCTGLYSTATAGSDLNYSFTYGGLDTATDRDSCDDTGVVVTWSAPASWGDGGAGTRTFTVYRGATDASGALVEGTTSFVDAGGVNGTSYDYSVVATNGYGCTAGGATTLPATDNVGSAPTFTGAQSVTTMPGNICGLRVEWGAATSNCAPGIVYNVYRSTTPGFTPDPTPVTGNIVASCVADLYYEDTAVSGLTNYYYVVRAEDSSAGHGGPCNSGFEDMNIVEAGGILTGANETGAQLTDPLQATSGAAASDFSPAFTFSTAATASLSYTLSHAGGAGGTLSYDYAPTPATINSNATTNFTQTVVENQTISSVSTTITMAPPSRNGSNMQVDLIHVSSGTSITVYNAATTGWADGTFGPYATFNGLSSASDWTLRITESGGTGGPSDGQLNSWNLSIDYVGTGDPTTCTQVELIDPSLTATVVKAYGAADANPYDVTALYTGAGTYQIQLSENCGGQGEITGASLSVDEPACVAASASPVEYFTGRSTGGSVKLEWENPTVGYSSTRICWSGTDFPIDPAACTVLVDQNDGAGNYGTTTHSGLANGSTYFYSAFVDNGSGEYSSRQTVEARPFDDTGKTKWAYHSSASALAPPGLYPGAAGVGAAYGVSNDRVLHSFNATTSGGDWPRTSPFAWMPMGMNGPAQDRPPVVSTTVGAADLVVFLGSQDGYVYAANAKTGETLWQSAQDYTLVQASPAGMFTSFGGAYNVLFAGSRVAGSGNSMYGINPATGANLWTYGGTIGIISSAATVDYTNSRIYFSSRENSTGSNHTMWCLSVTDSGASLLWSNAMGDIDAAPVLYDGVLYVGTNAGTVLALDPDTGAKIWRYETNDGPIKGFVDFEFIPVPRQLFFATSTSVWSLLDSGASVGLEWQQNTIAGPSIPLTLATQGEMYVGSTDGNLRQLNTSTGAIVTSLLMGAGTATVGSPGYDWANSLAYVGAEDGSVYAVTLPLSP